MDDYTEPDNKRRRFRIEEEDEFDDEDDDLLSHPSNEDEHDGDDEDEGIDGEDLEENWLKDYTAVPELDTYDVGDLASDADGEELSYRQRQAVDELLDERDRELRTRKEDRIDALAGIDEEIVHTGRFRAYGTIDDDRDDDDIPDETVYRETEVNLEAFDVPLREWIANERTRREIKKRFNNFLRRYRLTKDGPVVHMPLIKVMCSTNSSSLEVSYVHLGDMVPILAIWLADVPLEMLQIFDEVLKEVVLTEFNHYSTISQELHVRITHLPISDRLRDLRQNHLNCLIRVSGVITRRSAVYPQMKAVAYDCAHCGETMGPYRCVGIEMKPGGCPNCESMGPFKINSSRTEYGNYQKITLQESPGSVPAGRVPRYKDVILLGDLIDIARPGEEVEVTGIYMHNQRTRNKRDKGGFPVFSTIIEANYVQKKHGSLDSSITAEDKRLIMTLSDDPHIMDRIIASIAPSIFGHRHIKTAIALSLFGGVPKDGGNGTHRVRGDINILLLGDPGTAKSQMLKYAEKISPRAVYTTGKGASAVGLTAGVHRDPMTKEWTLEGGALVLADQGVCLIDEFDKMNEQDRTSIHEAMEQQTISVSKAGIVTSLQARCAVFAAANPIGGRYDPSFTLAENVELTDPILQRFDVLCVLQDVVDPIVDEQLASFVVSSHMKSHPNSQYMDDAEMDPIDGTQEDRPVGAPPVGMFTQGTGAVPIEQGLLKKYIQYARTHIRPVIRDVDSEKIASLYADLRTQSMASGGVPIAVRHIESIMRMAEASARLHFRQQVRDDDVDFAIKVMLESFMQAQKVSVRTTLQHVFRKYLTYGEENNQLIMHQLQNLIRTAEKYQRLRFNHCDAVKVYLDDFENKMKSLNIFDLRPFYQSALFKSYGLVLDERERVIVKSFV